MKRMRILGLAVLAVFAFGAITAVGASATEPGWYECAKNKTEGKLEKGCGKEGGKGGYEIKPGIGKGKAFKGKVGAATLHTSIPGKGDVPVKCASGKDVGNAALPNLQVKVVTTFSKCKAAGAPCQSGVKKETITTNSLAGQLGYISKEPLSVGADLASEAEPGSGFLAEFTCTGVASVRVHGAVIGIQTGDINAFSKTSTTTFETQEAEVIGIPGFKSVIQKPTKFEGGPTELLLSEFKQPESEVWEPKGGLPSGQEAVANNKGEAIEVKA